MKKILLSLLTLTMLLSACQKKEEDPTLVSSDPTTVSETSNTVSVEPEQSSEEGLKYLQMLRDFSPREKSEANEDNSEFDAFLDEVFLYFVENDYLYMHYTVEDYKSLGIEKPEVTVGEISYGINEEAIGEYEDLLNGLLSYDYDSLSYRQQYDYEILEYSMYETLADAYYNKYDLLFSESGLPSNLLTNFTEFVFYDQESLDDYMTLLADVDRYMEDALEYTKQQAEEGIALLDSGLDDSLEFISDFCAKTDDNELIATFNDRIEEVDFISEDEKQSYIAENERLVKEEIIPAYQNAATVLETLRGKSRLDESDAGVANYSKEYAELMVYLNASTNTDVDTLFNELEAAMLNYLYEIYGNYDDVATVNEYNEAYDNAESFNAFTLDGEGMLDYLQENLTKDYPETADIPYILSPLDPTVASDNVLAYYLSAPLDNLNYNVIRTNPGSLSSDPVDTYSTLAHEGFPGHLYQHVYYYRTNPHNFRSTIGFIGYTEGWAMQAELDAFDYVGFENEGTADLLAFDVYFSYVIQALCDIGVNYYGWNEEELADWLSDYVGSPASTASSIYEFCVNNPGTIMPYGLGLAQFVAIRSEAKNTMGDDFDIVAYNDKVLSNGEMPFVILKGAVKEYTGE